MFNLKQTNKKKSTHHNPKEKTTSRSTDNINNLEKVKLLLFYLESEQLDFGFFFQLILSILDSFFSLKKSCGIR